ncbi:MAG: hypothetical protein LBQ89_09080 [Treponema sp.]|jgi:hypothetical protein|nr:hypothetical protein [Treponema sp.]
MTDEIFFKRQAAFMDDVIKMHDKVKNIHVSLEKLYPITVINNGYFFIFDKNEIGHKYEFKRKVETSVVVSGEILTAFHLDFYDMKPSVVISENMIGNLGNDILVLHEFVHCFQLENGAIEIKNGLSIQKQEMAKKNYNWEIDFSFPYNNEYLIDKTMELSDCFTRDNYENVEIYRNCMRAYLHKAEYEYMIWQEWKEGFARYVENLIRKELGLRLNGNILVQPFGRVHFYEIGSKYIEMLIKNDKGLNDNIVKLFYNMFICE